MKYDNDEIIHKQIGNVEYLQFRELLKYKNLFHLYPLKHGGNSKNEYDSLNLGLFTEDNSTIVKENYMKICKLFNMKYNNMFIPKQIHGNIVVSLKKQTNTNIECDGSTTNTKNIILVSNSADCMNIILFDKEKNIIGSIHAGWKGVLNNICVGGIKKMISEYECDINDIIVCVWPSICKKCFVVEKDVVDMFEKEFINIQNYIQKNGETKYLIDLNGLQKKNLIEIGIKESNIHIANICTKCNKDDFYSYRNHKITGRHASFITLKGEI